MSPTFLSLLDAGLLVSSAFCEGNPLNVKLTESYRCELQFQSIKEAPSNILRAREDL